MSLTHFHPAVADWFDSQFAAPTPAQQAAWAAIRRGRHTLVAAPTGSGKTLAAFLQAIDGLVRAGLDGTLAEQTTVLYVSPLKALSNDINLNLLAPLTGIAEALKARGLPEIELRSMVRTGDTPQSERVAMRKRPPHILVTTPESLYILLGSESGRRMLASVKSVIVDEIHAVVRSKRGAHLALSLARLEALTASRLLRIGLSATQSPIVEVARFLVGSGAVEEDGAPDCEIVDTGHVRARDLALELGPQPLGPVMSGLAWEQIYDRLAVLGREHRTTLVFVNTRRMVERVTRHLSERVGSEWVAAHHGSLSKELRLNAEQRLKAGQLKVLVATASLELGIDIGDVDLVCQIGSPNAIDFDLPAARRPIRPCGRRLAQGSLVPAVARRSGRVHRPARLRAPRRTGSAENHRRGARCAGAADGRRGRRAGMQRGRAVRDDAAAPGPMPVSAARTSTRCCACSPPASRRGAGRAQPTFIAMR